MKERLKTFLLISLVGISLLLTKRLWMELPNETFKLFAKGDKVYSTSYLLSDMIMPNKYLLNFNEKYLTLFYDDSKYKLWTNSRKTLGTILGSKDIKTIDLSDEEFLQYKKKPSLVFYFPEKVNTFILAKALDVKDPSSIVDTIQNVKDIYIYLGKGDSFFVFTDGDKHLAILDSTIDISHLKEQFLEIEKEKGYNYYYSARDTYGIDKDIYIPYEMKNSLSTVYVENEIRNLDEENKRKIAERYFNKSIDYIREIVEGNESTIYEYNHRVLKLNINGTVEYYHPLEEIIKKRNLYESLSTSAEFISQNAGITKGMYLAKVEEIQSDESLGYNLTFRYRVRGLPVILGNEEVVDFIQIEVFNNHIRSYKHFIRKDINRTMEDLTEDKKLLTSLDIIDINYDFLVGEYLREREIKDSKESITIDQVLTFLDDITLSYFDPCLKDMEDKLIPVWVIKTESSLYAFNVYDGNLEYRRDR
ncbi:MAG: YycH family regulatory protein [Tissierellaceae bacterium]|nr:YycH family regulatory protein [Tissierellaceae bacterium]